MAIGRTVPSERNNTYGPEDVRRPDMDRRTNLSETDPEAPQYLRNRASVASIDGAYKDLSAGNLVTDKHTEDKEPYLFRASAGGKSEKEEDTIVGGTVAWNQLTTGSRESSSGANIVWENLSEFKTKVTGTTSGTTYRLTKNDNISFCKDNKYYVKWGDSLPTNIDICLGVSSEYGYASAHGQIDSIINCNVANVGYLGMSTASNIVLDNILEIQLVNLTTMFGSTIADYIYTLEQTTAGAGVAFFKKLFPNDYYAYDAGTLKSVEGLQSHKYVGFNQWDEEWESGDINDATGLNEDNANQWRSKNYVPILPGISYYTKNSNYQSNFRVFFYDAKKEYISYASTGGTSTFVTPNNAYYLRFRWNHIHESSETQCINLSDPSRNGEYEPYVEHEYALDDSLVLRGMPKLVDGKLQYNGDIYHSDGTVVRRYGIVDLGTLSWYYESTSHYMYATLLDANVVANRKLLCVSSNYAAITDGRAFSNIPDKSIYGLLIWDDAYIAVLDAAYNNATDFETAMSGVYLVYELAESTIEQADPYQEIQIVDPYGTEEYVTTGIVPVGHITKYPDNLRAKIEGLPWDLSMIAPIELGTTASQAYSIGEYFIKDNQFCKAKTSIASGATFTLNTNYTVTTVAAELYTALNS